MQPRDLSAHEPYVAGRGATEVARDLGLDPDEILTLASNENQLGASPAAVDALRSATAAINRYPKAAHVDLQDALADRWGVERAQVWLASGADGAIDYLSRAMLDPDDAVLVPEPGFAYYGMSARYHHGTVATYPVSRAVEFALTADTVLDAYGGERLVYCTTPHSPTGSEFDRGALERIADETDPDTLLVVDEAYAEFSTAPSARELVDLRDDVAVLRTFSKAYGLAGLRLGYALVPDDWADAYARINTPFAVSELACRAGIAALADEEHLERSVETARWSRDYMREELHPRSWPSGGNFVLVDVTEATDAGEGTPPQQTGNDAERGDDTPAERVAAELRERGVLVRDCTSFGLPRCIRITCGTREETKRAVDAVNDVVSRVRA